MRLHTRAPNQAKDTEFFFHPTHPLFCPSFDLHDANVEDEAQV